MRLALVLGMAATLGLSGCAHPRPAPVGFEPAGLRPLNCYGTGCVVLDADSSVRVAIDSTSVRRVRPDHYAASLFYDFTQDFYLRNVSELPHTRRLVWLGRIDCHRFRTTFGGWLLYDDRGDAVDAYNLTKAAVDPAFMHRPTDVWVEPRWGLTRAGLRRACERLSTWADTSQRPVRQ